VLPLEGLFPLDDVLNASLAVLFYFPSVVHITVEKKRNWEKYKPIVSILSPRMHKRVSFLMFYEGLWTSRGFMIWLDHR